MKLSLNFEQLVNAIVTVGATNTIMAVGAPGMGKTAAATAAARKLPDYKLAYVDCANLDLGDIGFPVIDRERMVTQMAIASRFGLVRGSQQPLLLVLDECSKCASRAVMNTLLPVIAERRIFEYALPPGSIVYCTGNLTTDGVGDTLPAHAYNRMTVVDFRNPDPQTWVTNYAIPAGLNPVVIRFAVETPEAFVRYDTLGEKQTNPYIFNPRTGNVKSYVSLRSLEKASHILDAADALGDSYMALMAGTVGEAAALQMDALRLLDLQLPATKLIVADPHGAQVPTELGALYMMATRLATQASPKTIEAMTTYVTRWGANEAKTLFATLIGENKEKLPFALRTTNFSTLAAGVGRFF